MRLSYVERVMLSNQYKILSLLDTSNADHYDKVREALEYGYESYYQEAFNSEVSEDILSSEESLLVIDAMDMYWAMQTSYANLRDDVSIERHMLDFPGFDGNHETKLYTYLRFVVEKQERFQSLRLRKDMSAVEDQPPALLDRYNSHMPMTDIYRHRVDFWKPLPKRYELSEQEIRDILSIT